MADRDSDVTSPNTSSGKERRPRIGEEWDVFSSLAAQEIQQLVTSPQSQQDLEHSSNRRISTLMRPSTSASKEQSGEDLGESQGDEGGDPKGKRKLTKGQVRELEKIFQAGYTGAPSGRCLVAAELKITERQVAIWFQNRRARQRSKQMQSDFELLKRDFRLVLLDNKQLRQEVTDLQSQLASQVLVRVPPLKDESDPAFLTFPLGTRGEASDSILDTQDTRWQQALMHASQTRLPTPPVPGRAALEHPFVQRESAHHLHNSPLPASKKARLSKLEPLPNDFSRNEGFQRLDASAGVLSSVIQSLQQQLGPNGNEAMNDILRTYEGAELSARDVSQGMNGLGAELSRAPFDQVEALESVLLSLQEENHLHPGYEVSVNQPGLNSVSGPAWR